MTKYKYTRKEIVKKWSSAFGFTKLGDLYKDLLATIPDERNAYTCPAHGKFYGECRKCKLDEECKCLACEYPLVKYIHTCENRIELNKQLRTPTPSPLDELEEITEFPYKDFGDGSRVIGSREGAINILIRNQNRLVEIIKNLMEK